MKLRVIYKRSAIAIITLTLVVHSLFVSNSNNDLSKYTALADDSSTSFNSLSCEEQVSEYHLMVERILYSAIEESVNKVYGPGKRTSWDYKIIDVERGYYREPYMYRVTIEFETFTGAHNPPFDTNIATYDIINFSPLEIKEIHYEHYLTEE